MAEDSIPPDIRKMSFDQALDDLKAIVGKLEQGQGTLDSAIGDYDRGADLKPHCDAKLREAEAKIAQISLADARGVTRQPLDVEDPWKRCVLGIRGAVHVARRCARRIKRHNT